MLIADEPTGNLDPNLSLEIFDLFSQFNDIGVTTVIASHDLTLIARMAYRILRLKDGCLMGGRGQNPSADKSQDDIDADTGA